MNNEDRYKAQEHLTKAWRGCNKTIQLLKPDKPYSDGDIAILRECKGYIDALKAKFEKPYPPEQNEIIIIDNPKPDWMPMMVCDIVDLPFCVGRDYSWTELEELVIQLSLAGCDAIRIFGTSWEPYVEPFMKMPTGRYSLLEPNDEWDEVLERFANLLHKYHMKVYIDLYDNCSINKNKYPWNPFFNSTTNFMNGFYDERADKVAFLMERWDDRILEILDKNRDIVGFCNEANVQQFGGYHLPSGEPNIPKIHSWAENWGVPRALNIFEQGFMPPVCFSGGGATGHKLFAHISAEVHPEYFDNEAACMQVHGLGMPEHVENYVEEVWEGQLSQVRVFSYTDDGVGANPPYIPEELRGYCEIRKNGQEYACTANTETRIETVHAFREEVGNSRLLHSIAFLPRSILYKGKTVLSRLDTEVDCDIYWRLADELWGVDIKRSVQE